MRYYTLGPEVYGGKAKTVYAVEENSGGGEELAIIRQQFYISLARAQSYGSATPFSPRNRPIWQFGGCFCISPRFKWPKCKFAVAGGRSLDNMGEKWHIFQNVDCLEGSLFE
jgi:hypothetical protein